MRVARARGRPGGQRLIRRIDTEQRSSLEVVVRTTVEVARAIFHRTIQAKKTGAAILFFCMPCASTPAPLGLAEIVYARRFQQARARVQSSRIFKIRL